MVMVIIYAFQKSVQFNKIMLRMKIAMIHGVPKVLVEKFGLFALSKEMQINRVSLRSLC